MLKNLKQCACAISRVGTLIVFSIMTCYGMSIGQLSDLPVLIRDVVGESNIVKADIEDSVLTCVMKLPSGGEGWFIVIAIAPDKDAAKKFYQLKSMEVATPPSGNFSLGDEAQAWRSLGTGGTIIFRRGTVVACLSGGLDWQRLNQAAISLESKISAVPLQTLVDQFAALEAAASAQEKLSLLKAESAVLDAEDAKKEAAALIAKLQAGGSDAERQKAILALGNLGDQSAIATLLTQIDSKYSTGVRSHAIKALAKLHAKEAVPMLVEILKKPASGNLSDDGDYDAIIRRQAVIALGAIGDKSALAVLTDVQNREKEYNSVKESASVSIQEIKK
jgi:putative Ca2+/H+ antiporter (TMEM165/GDT1 family)